MTTAISWLDDPTIGDWIAAEQLTEHGVVGSLVPPRFESYVSVRLAGEDATAVNPDRALREHLVATIKAYDHRPSGCIFGVSDVYGWDGRTTGHVGVLREAPTNGEVDMDALQGDLQARLEGARPASSEPSLPPLLETAIRSYMLYRGDVDDADAAAAAGGPTEIPDLWWPEHRGWFVATDTDLDFVIVAGPETLMGALDGRGVYVENLTARSWLS